MGGIATRSRHDILFPPVGNSTRPGLRAIVMKDEDDNVPEALKEMIARNSDGRIRIDNQTPPRLGWRSARVTISVPGSSEPVSFTVHWREPSTCYIGFRRFRRPDST